MEDGNLTKVRRVEDPTTAQALVGSKTPEYL